MQPITKTTGIYSQPPEDKLIRCPHCTKILNHHLTSASTAVVPFGDNRNKVIDLFGQKDLPKIPRESPKESMSPPDTIEVPLTTGELPTAIMAGDIYVPQVIGAFEQVVTGQAQPEKQAGHVIRGMAPSKEQLSPPKTHPSAEGLKILDNPLIGGKVTICVCLYGEEHEALHRRCLNSICQTVPPSRMDLRVACNQVGLGTINYLNSLPITKIYSDHKNRRKYPAMRQMFHDPTCPIETNYVIWFDDDSYTKNPHWLSILAQTIVAQKPQDKVGCFGHRMIHPLKHPQGGDPTLWFRSAIWWRDRGFQDNKGRDTPNGDKVHFPVGGFWCISKQAIIDCDIPDIRLNHNGGDCCIGEQLHQGGYKTKMFNEKKQYIKTSGAPRRGYHEVFPWMR